MLARGGQPRMGGRHWLFKLSHKNARPCNQRRLRGDIFGRDTPRRAGRHDDGIIAAGLFDENHRRPCIAVGVFDHRRANARLRPNVMRYFGKFITPQPRDKAHIAARACCGHGLVGSLTPWPQRKAAAQDGFPHARHPRRAIGGIGHENAQNNDRFHGIIPWGQSRLCAA